MAATKKRTVSRASKARSEVPQVLVDDGVLDVDQAAEVVPFTYAITAYGADYPVDSLIKRMREGDISIPLFSSLGSRLKRKVRFQREYVWKKQQADRFIESLLLGLPVPGIFLVKEEAGKHLVLDGHQRLQTLARYYRNEWEDGEFPLQSVQDRFKGRVYQALEPSDRRRLDDSIIHATIIRQDQPSNDLSSIYLIFERLNSGGTTLQPQEIRVALYHGPFVELLLVLNENPNWRALFGRRSKRLKDMELILRFFAMTEASKSYERPMKGFLSGYVAQRRYINPQIQTEYSDLFAHTVDAILQGIGTRAFKPRGTLNAALVDALMVAIARRIRMKGPISRPSSLKPAYKKLLKGLRFQGAISKATADEDNVKTRLDLACTAFKDIP